MENRLFEEYSTIARRKGLTTEDLRSKGTETQVLHRVTAYLLNKDSAIQNWKDTIRHNHDDCMQELETIKLEQYIHLINRIERGKLKISREDASGEYHQYIIEDVDELTFRELFSLLYSKVKRDFIRYLSNAYNSVNYRIQISVEVTEEGTMEDVMNRIEDKAQEEELKAAELIEAIKGSLTVNQYNYLLKWMKEGKQPTDDSKMKNRVKEALREYTSGEIALAVSYKLNRLYNM